MKKLVLKERKLKQMASPRIKIDVTMEVSGKQYPVANVTAKVRDVIAEKFSDVNIKKIGIYMIPETNFVYYTINGEGSPEQCISLDDIEA